MINACNSDIRLINMTHIAEIQVINSSGYYLYEAITLHEQLDKAWVLQTSYLLVKASNKVKKKSCRPLTTPLMICLVTTLPPLLQKNKLNLSYLFF